MLLAFAGKKESGKDTAANLIFGFRMIELGMIKSFTLNEHGKISHQDGEYIDIESVEAITHEYFAPLWSKAFRFSFADRLKEHCIDFMGLTRQQCYTQAGKKEKTKINWSVFAKPGKKTKVGYMTVREVLQETAKFYREIDNDIFVRLCLEDISRFPTDLAIITDCRHKNEVAAIKENGGLVVKLTRVVDQDDDSSENDLDGIPNSKFDAVIDNQNMTIQEYQVALVETLTKLGVLEVE